MHEAGHVVHGMLYMACCTWHAVYNMCHARHRAWHTHPTLVSASPSVSGSMPVEAVLVGDLGHGKGTVRHDNDIPTPMAVKYCPA